MKSWYRRRILPRILESVMSSQVLDRERAELIPMASGRVLEVGIGSGLNLPHYTDQVTELLGLEPSAALREMATTRAQELGRELTLIDASAEAIPLPDDHVDTAVMTWTLCSIPDPGAALAEIRRVLRPTGRLLFEEHGLSPDRGVAFAQRGLEPAWRPVSGGCHLTRQANQLLAEAGFEVTSLKTGYVPGFRFASYQYRGIACAPSSAS